MKKIINYLIIHFFLVSMAAQAQYTSIAQKRYSLMQWTDLFCIKNSEKEVRNPFVVIYNHKPGEVLNIEDVYKKYCIKENLNWRLNNDIIQILINNKDKRILSGKISFDYPVLKLDDTRSHCLLYFLEKEYPYWKDGKTSIKTLKNYVEIIINKGSSEGILKKVRYDIK